MKTIQETAKLLEQAKEKIGELSGDLSKLNEEYKSKLIKHFSDLGLKFDEEELKEFFKKPYILLPKEKQEWYCLVPTFVDFQVGYFDRREGNYNIYLINKYSRWMNDIPEFMLDEIELPEADNIYVKDGELRFDENLKDKIKEKFGNKLKSIDKNKAKIKQGSEFDLIAELIEEGNLPFVPRPVDKDDLREPKLNFKTEGKYSYQEKAYEEWLKYGSLGVYWMTGAGKSFIGMKTLDSLKYDEKKFRKALVTVSTTLKDQWKLYFEQYAPRLLDEVEIYTYQAYNKIMENIKMGNKYGMIVFDENDRLPANTYSRYSTIDTKYRLGLSATPYREDGRTNYIFALTGKPIGLDWQSLINILEKKLHQINIYILKKESDKISKVRELLDLNKKTLIFSDSIKLGKQISKKFNLPFIHGKSKKRLKTLEENKINVVSRVMDYGISIKDLQHIIEVDFLFGSRKQQVQRTGRLLHSLSKDSQHDILFTTKEFNKYKKRLFGLVEKGFKLNFFNEATKDKVKIETENVKSMSSVKLPEKKKETQKQVETPLSVEHSKIDYENFLRNETVKELIKESMDGRASSTAIKGILALIFQRKNPVSYEEIRKSLGYSSTTQISQACSELEKYELIKRIKEENIQKIDFNVEGIDEIVKLKKEREKSEKLMEDLFD